MCVHASSQVYTPLEYGCVGLSEEAAVAQFGERMRVGVKGEGEEGEGEGVGVGEGRGMKAER